MPDVSAVDGQNAGMTRTTPAVALEVDNVAQSYGQREVLHDVSLKIRAGEVLALIGANGAGKSSLMNIIAGIRRPTRGEVKLNGAMMTRATAQARARLGYATQDVGLYLRLTVRDNLRFFAEMAGLDRATIDRRVTAVSAALVLDGILDRPASRLSGGERRRAHAAAAMIHSPDVLLLDEPTAGVDVETRQAVLDAVAKLASEGTAVCYTTHYLHEVEALDASIAVLHKGAFVATGTLETLLASHGRTSVVLDFEGPPPDLSRKWSSVVTSGQQVSILDVENPPSVVREVYRALGKASASITNIRIRTPSLESVFLSLTGSLPAVDQA